MREVSGFNLVRRQTGEVQFVRMPKTLRYRLFKAGAMPAALRAKIETEQILVLDEGISVMVRRRGSGPGFRGSGTGRFSGAFAITDARIVASISSTVMADAPYTGKDAKGGDISLSDDGLHIKVDASTHPAFTGTIEMHFKHDFSAEELSRFPYRQLAFDFPSALVPKIFGVPG